MIVPSILFLLQIINNEIDAQLFSWDSINTNKLVPKNLKNRLRALDSQLNNLETDCSDIDIKVKTINSAYETAESLPAVIQILMMPEKSSHPQFRKLEMTLTNIRMR